ncbi:hypothetical protein ACFSYG_10115 [Leeuwenhoekiella polynyae]|uniref:Two component regulator with propeller domain n=1 Tax=Leeuwenhoekiella polynyae TaxID=1550906 RepID=A0A4Q0PFK2_9FLAO|nr:hypothetical protein [Leeuwenhoekiella polynyae]RXG25601.1 hypothetical protein DSM02_767 [Leeuwenhoekiella polynyae]
MKKILGILLGISYAAVAQNYYPLHNIPKPANTYTLKESLRTSAGVYTEDGTLLRTLWSNLEKKSGTHRVVWDRLDDEGKPVNDTTTTIKILANKVNYEWKGIIGNTSNTHGGDSIFNNAQVIQGMIQVGEQLYYNCGYNEHDPAFEKFKINNINKNIPVLSRIHYGLEVPYICADEKRIFIGGLDIWNDQKPTMVFAINIADNAQYDFTHGSQYTLASNHKYRSVIGRVQGEESRITGMAVQNNGNYLFIARGKLNSISVYDKNTGRLVNTFTDFINPRELKIIGNQLWCINNKMIEQYTILTNGFLDNRNIFNNTIKEPLAMALNKTGKNIAIADGETNQIKIFNSAGSLIKTLGISGGYRTNPNVLDHKFMLINPAQPEMKTFLCYQDDGKLWVGDTGNYRSLRFNTDYTLDDFIMYQCWIRSMGVDRSNPTRVFANYLEFSVDIEKGNWKLVKNWAGNFKIEQDGEYDRLKWVSTLSNGKTYAFQLATNATQWEVVELADTGLRYTGIKIKRRTPTATLLPNGNIRYFDGELVVKPNQPPLYWKERSLTGFDQNDNPVWGDLEEVANTGILQPSDPIYRETISWNYPPRNDTESNLIISFEGGSAAPDYSSNKYHLGATKKGETGFKWKTAVGTARNYYGPYPEDGRYDMGNGVQYPGGVILVEGKNIFWNYHGEFWKQMQTNIFTHVYDNGLMVGKFGVTGADIFKGKRVWDQTGVPGMAGNNLKGDIISLNGDLYILHGDEGWHGGIHIWKISNLNSIKEFNIPTAKN